MKRNIYLKKKTLEEAKTIALGIADLIHLGTETIRLIISFFFSHQRVWVKIPVKAGGEIVMAGSNE